jgi:hypothetical protein
MTQEEFISILDEKGYSYEIEGDRIVVTHGGVVDLLDITSLPPGVEFRNKGEVYFDALTSISPDVKFENEGDVDLESLTSISPGVEFRNKGEVGLSSLTSLPPGVVFRNGGLVWLDALIGGYFSDWRGNIEGIDSKSLLNKMIKQGVFER